MRRRAARVLLDCPGRMGEDLLLHEPDARAARDRDVPCVRRFETGRDAEQGGLPHPVGSDQSDTITVCETERDIAEHESLAEPLRDRLDREDAHGSRGSQRGTTAATPGSRTTKMSERTITPAEP